MRTTKPEPLSSNEDDILRRTMYKSAKSFRKLRGKLHRVGLQTEDLAQEGIAYALQYGKQEPKLRVFIGKRHMYQFLEEAKQKELPKGKIRTEDAFSNPTPDKKLSRLHQGFEEVDNRDLLGFVLTRITLPPWKVQIATDLLTERRTGAFLAKQRGCSGQRISEIKQEFLRESRKLLSIEAA